MTFKLPSSFWKTSLWFVGASALLTASLASAERFIISIEPGVTVESVMTAIETFTGQEFPILSNTTVLPGVSSTFVVEMDPDTVRTIADFAPGLGGFLNSIPGFQFIEEDSQQTVPEPPIIAGALDTSTTDFVPYGIPMVQADQVSDENTGSITVCVLDTGIDTDHVDLPTANIQAFDYFGEGTPEDLNGHGTHCSGTIAAVANDEGLVGVNSGGFINLISGKVLGAQGYGYVSSQLEAIEDCAALGANIVSMSLGGPFSQARQDAIDYHTANSNMLFIAAAGNSGNSDLSYPASHDSVMSVAAVDEDMVVAGFSQFNSQVEISGPGVDVWSTIPGDQYAQFSGTSMATPHVAGVAALIWSYNPSWTNQEIRSALQSTALDLGVAGRDVNYGFGLVQARAALDLLQSGTPIEPPETNPPEPETPECVTSPEGWTDSAGDDCSWYTSNARCFLGLFFADENGVTARDACCECDGGAAGNCEDESGWVDSYGDGCDWYEEEDDRCELYGGCCAGTGGLTANEACCVCKGATVSTVSDKADLVTTFSPTATPDDSGASSLFSALSLFVAAMVAGVMVM